MSDEKKPAAEPKPARKLTDDESASVVGGMGTRPGGGGGTGGTLSNSNPPSCEATADTGMMGCPG